MPGGREVPAGCMSQAGRLEIRSVMSLKSIPVAGEDVEMQSWMAKQ